MNETKCNVMLEENQHLLPVVFPLISYEALHIVLCMAMYYFTAVALPYSRMI